MTRTTACPFRVIPICITPAALGLGIDVYRKYRLGMDTTMTIPPPPTTAPRISNPARAGAAGAVRGSDVEGDDLPPAQHADRDRDVHGDRDGDRARVRAGDHADRDPDPDRDAVRVAVDGVVRARAGRPAARCRGAAALPRGSAGGRGEVVADARREGEGSRHMDRGGLPPAPHAGRRRHVHDRRDAVVAGDRAPARAAGHPDVAGGGQLDRVPSAASSSRERGTRPS